MTPAEAVSKVENEYTFERTGNNLLATEEWQTIKTAVLAANYSDLMLLLRRIKQCVDIEGGFDHDDYCLYQQLDAVVAQQH